MNTLKIFEGPTFDAAAQELTRLIGEGVSCWRNETWAIDDFRGWLAATDHKPTPEDAGSINDLFVFARLKLIFEVNGPLYRSYARMSNEAATFESEVVLNMWPALEFVTGDRQRVPPEWRDRWLAAGGEIYKGRLLALPDDPVWANLSIFRLPYPPFELSENYYDAEEISDDVAKRLGFTGLRKPLSAEKIPAPLGLYFFNRLPEAATPQTQKWLADFFARYPPSSLAESLLHAAIGIRKSPSAESDSENGRRVLSLLLRAIDNGLASNPRLTAQAYRAAGEVYEQWGSAQEAVTYYEYALELDKKIGVKGRIQKLKSLETGAKRSS